MDDTFVGFVMQGGAQVRGNSNKLCEPCWTLPPVQHMSRYVTRSFSFTVYILLPSLLRMIFLVISGLAVGRSVWGNRCLYCRSWMRIAEREHTKRLPGAEFIGSALRPSSPAMCVLQHRSRDARGFQGRRVLCRQGSLCQSDEDPLALDLHPPNCKMVTTMLLIAHSDREDSEMLSSGIRRVSHGQCRMVELLAGV